MDASGAVARKEREFSSFEQIEAVIRGFENGTLPKTQWTHRAHLLVACWYLVCHPAPEATERIREGIMRYNASQGILTTPTGGYHETMTIFWIRMIRSYLATASLDCSLVGLMNEMLSLYDKKYLPFEYYSRERILSQEARATWIEPDLKPLPEIKTGSRREKNHAIG
jgi:hypothetical protein